jgi:Restriction endonuclease
LRAMSKRSDRKKRPGKNTPPPSTAKGKLVEEIVEKMHGSSDVRVQRRVFLEPVGGGGRKREIDVLLTRSIAGIPVSIAIECKNEAKKIGSPKIDAFVGKLQHVGIPPQLGIYVSTSDYTGGAIERARKAGIKTLVLTGLTKDRLSAAVERAFQSMVYLFVEVTQLQVVNEVSTVEEFAELSIFYDADGVPRATLGDMVWQAWVEGLVSSDLGEHELRFEVPEGWHNVVDGKTVPAIAISAVIRVVGLVATFSGEARQHTLFDAANKRAERWLTDVAFDGSLEPSYPMRGFGTEEELREYLESQKAVRVVGRLKMPRIRVGALYWPPSERTTKKIAEIMKAYEAGEIDDPRPLKFTEIEGTDLNAVFEPIWRGPL